MTVQATITFSSFLLENKNSFTFYEAFLTVSIVRNNLTYDLRTFYGGSAYGYCSVFVNEQYSVKFENGAMLCSQIVDKQLLSVFYFELLSLNLNNNVHFYFLFLRLSLPGGANRGTSF